MSLRPTLFLPVLAALFLAACSGDSNSDSTPTTSSGGASPTSPAGSTPEPGETETGPVELKLDPVLDGFKRPTYVTGNGVEGDERLFVVEKSGVIRIVENGAIVDEPFLDMTSEVNSSGNEQGLLGLAFHPEFASNGRFFVAYTAAGSGANTLAEYAVSDDPGKADQGSGKLLLAIEDFASNHNGGMLVFGPDGYLYMSTGDGGQGGDPRENGQNKDALLGKILRLDVNSAAEGKGYGIPADNPFANGGGAPEAWAYGLRNPWRISFDRETGDLYIADVGQGKQEEVNFQAADSKGGENYGWNVAEGPECYNATGCDLSPFVAPVASYSHADGSCSVTGGFVYRGASYPRIAGLYFYADYCSGKVYAMGEGADGKFTASQVLDGIKSITSFGEDNNGEIYAVDDDGNLRKLTAESVAAAPSTPGSNEVGKLTLQSPRIEDGESIPEEFTCDGEGGSPQISWNPIPPKARSYVLLLDDVSEKDNPKSQWVLFNIPSVLNYISPSVPEGEMLGAGPILQGKNDDGTVRYGAPCPGDGKERTYRFTAYAIDENLDIKGGSTRDEILKAIEGHIVAQGELSAKYKGK